MSKEINLDADELAPQEASITYRGKAYVLREASGLQVRRFRSDARKGSKTDQPDPESADKALAALVAGCLVERTAEGNERKVTAEELSGWTTRALETLYKEAVAMNSLGGTAGTPEGNGQAPPGTPENTPDG
jgi:hypothetical protein